MPHSPHLHNPPSLPLPILPARPTLPLRNQRVEIEIMLRRLLGFPAVNEGSWTLVPELDGAVLAFVEGGVGGLDAVAGGAGAVGEPSHCFVFGEEMGVVDG